MNVLRTLFLTIAWLGIGLNAEEPDPLAFDQQVQSQIRTDLAGEQVILQSYSNALAALKQSQLDLAGEMVARDVSAVLEHYREHGGIGDYYPYRRPRALEKTITEHRERLNAWRSSRQAELLFVLEAERARQTDQLERLIQDEDAARFQAAERDLEQFDRRVQRYLCQRDWPAEVPPAPRRLPSGQLSALPADFLAYRPTADETIDVNSLALSPDGRHLLTASRKGAVKMFDLRSGRLIQEFTSANYFCRTALFHPDGTRVFGAGGMHLEEWDAATGIHLGSNKAHVKGISRLLISQNKRQLITTSMDRSIRFWNLETRRPTMILQRMTEHMRGLVPLDKQRGIGGLNGAMFACEGLRVIDFRTGRLGPALGKPSEWITDLCVDRQQRRAYTTTLDGFLACIDLENGTEQWRIHPSTLTMTGLCLSSDESLVFAGARIPHAVVYAMDANTGKLVWQTQQAPTTYYDILPIDVAGKPAIAVGAGDGRVRFFQGPDNPTPISGSRIDVTENPALGVRTGDGPIRYMLVR